MNPPPASEFAGYSFYRNRLPDTLRPATLDHSLGLTEIFNQEAGELGLIEEVLLFPPGRSWKFRPADFGVNLVVFGTFRSEYKTIVTIAELLADFSARTNFQPVVAPMRTKLWSAHLEQQTSFFNLLRREAITSYSTRYA